MKGKYYLSQILTPNRLKGNFINVIKCPTGAGKTTFALGELPKYVNSEFEILYITDTNMNKEQIISNNSNTRAYRKSWREFVNENNILIPNGWGSYKDTYITVMNYAQVGAILYYKHPFDWSKFQFVVCDELHNLINYQNIRVKEQSVNILNYARAKIDDTLNNFPNVKVIGLTATPDKVYKEFINTYDILTPQEYNDLYTYETFDTKEYRDYIKIFNYIPQGTKGIIYFTHITNLKVAEQFLIRKGHKTAGFWSVSNEEHSMTDRQKAVRKYIIDNQMIPNDVDILLINSSCETGVNIKNSDIDFMIIHSSDNDTITQVRGRLRNDLRLLYSYSATEADIKMDVPQEYLNRPLTADEKKLLCDDEIRLLNQDGTPYQWKTVKPYLENNGYKITDKTIKRNGKSKRASVIEKIAIEK